MQFLGTQETLLFSLAILSSEAGSVNQEQSACPASIHNPLGPIHSTGASGGWG